MTNRMEDAFKEAGVKAPEKVVVTVVNEPAMRLIHALIHGQADAKVRYSGHNSAEIHFTDRPGHVLVLDARGMWQLKTQVTLL